jgi:hypothetical protein
MTDRTTDIATLITQLRVVGQLTRTEAQVARLRVTQASSDAVRQELRQNAADADARAGRIGRALRDLGALPDTVTPLFGRVAALVRGALEQAQPLDEAVLGDLALEHQLRDRARYVAALADATGQPAVRALADDLAAAHTETIRWLTDLLADLGAGRQAALGASPLQQVAAQVTHVANAPARGALDKVGAGVAETVQTAAKVAGAARDTAAEALQTASAATGDAAAGLAQGAATAAGTVRDTVTETTGKAVSGAVQAAGTVRGTAAQAAERSADVVGDAAGAAADAVVNVTRTAVEIATATATNTATATTDAFAGTMELAAEEAAAHRAAADDATETAAERSDTAGNDTAGNDTAGNDTGDTGRTGAPPIPGFADLPPHAAVAALRTLDDPRDVAAMLEFEQAHGNRPAVVAAAHLRAAAVGPDDHRDVTGA